MGGGPAIKLAGGFAFVALGKRRNRSRLQTLDFRVWDEYAGSSPSPATTAALTIDVFKLVRGRFATHLALANHGALRMYAEEVKHSPELLVPAGELHDGGLDWT